MIKYKPYPPNQLNAETPTIPKKVVAILPDIEQIPKAFPLIIVS